MKCLYCLRNGCKKEALPGSNYCFMHQPNSNRPEMRSLFKDIYILRGPLEINIQGDRLKKNMVLRRVQKRGRVLKFKV